MENSANPSFSACETIRALKTLFCRRLRDDESKIARNAGGGMTGRRAKKTENLDPKEHALDGGADACSFNSIAAAATFTF